MSFRIPNSFNHLFLQAIILIIGLIVSLGIGVSFFEFETFLVLGFLGLIFSLIFKFSIWWKIIHTIFLPSLYLVHQQNIEPTWFLVGFFILFLLFKGATTDQVPLYFSNQKTIKSLADILSTQQSKNFLDIGAGIGTTISPLTKQFPQMSFYGVENAPLSWLIGQIRLFSKTNVQWKMKNLWETDLSEFDVVYAFLSPVPMTAIWEKAKKEMKPGSLLISNTFQIEGVQPYQIIEIDCTPKRTLYLYKI